MKPGEIYRSKFTICRDDARYVVMLKSYLGNDEWSCDFGISPDKHYDAELHMQVAGSTIEGKTLFKNYERIK